MAREVVLEVNDLTGGLNRHATASLMGKSQSRRLRNVDVSDPGAWKPRPGFTHFGITNVTAGNGFKGGMSRIYLDGVDPFVLFSVGGNVHKVPDSGTADAVVVSGFSDTTDHFYPHDGTMVAVVDSVNIPQKSTNGTDWTQLGITPPAAAPGVAAIAGGSLVSGHTYEFSYAYADDDDLVIKSNESDTAQQAVSGGNLSVRVTVTFSADPQVDTIKVYARDVTAGESVRRFAGEVANPGSGTVTVDVTMNNWSAEEEAPSRNTVAPADLVFAIPFKGRWWGWTDTEPRVLRFSELFQPNYWPVNYGIEMPFSRGDKIRAAAIDGDVLVIFGGSSAFMVVAQTAADFEVRPTRATVGAFGPRAVSPLMSGGIAHAAAAGVFVLSGEADQILSTGFEREWREMVSTAAVSDTSRIPVQYHARDKELRIAVPLLMPYGDAGEFVLSLERPDVGAQPAWTTTNREITCYMVWDGPEIVAGNVGRIFSFNDLAGNTVREESVGTSAQGNNQSADYEGPELIPAPGRTSRFLKLCLDFEPNDGTFGVEVRVDGLSITTLDVPIGDGLAVYGTAEYGSAVYGGKTRTRKCFDLPLTAEGESIQIVGEYQGQARFQWFGYRIPAAPEPHIRGI